MHRMECLVDDGVRAEGDSSSASGGAPSRTISSSPERISARACRQSLLSIGVPSSPARPRRRLSFGSTRKVRRALERVADPQVQVIPRSGLARSRGCRGRWRRLIVRGTTGPYYERGGLTEKT